MRIISWNLHGASVPGRSSTEKQIRAWDYMRGLGADLILAQEASLSALPAWVGKQWTFVAGEYGRFRKNWTWGSIIAAKPELCLVPHHESLEDLWLAQLYDLVIVGQVQLTTGPVVVASVHTAAVSVRDWLRDYAVSLSLSDNELQNLRRPHCTEAPYLNDLAFTALVRTVGDRPFIIAGDWNTCRKYRGGPEFFSRAQSHAWMECHALPEEQTYFGKSAGGYQLDHAFVDQWTAASVIGCQINANSLVRDLSDHAPMVIDIDWAGGRDTREEDQDDLNSSGLSAAST